VTRNATGDEARTTRTVTTTTTTSTATTSSTWDKHREFMSHKPLMFSNSPDPLQAYDWLKTVDKMLNIAQCTDREKVLYVSGHLTSPAADWWDSYCAAHAAVNTITWAKFSTQF
jgi:hypothetical protein